MVPADFVGKFPSRARPPNGDLNGALGFALSRRTLTGGVGAASASAPASAVRVRMGLRAHTRASRLFLDASACDTVAPSKGGGTEGADVTGTRRSCGCAAYVRDVLPCSVENGDA